MIDLEGMSKRDPVCHLALAFVTFKFVFLIRKKTICPYQAIQAKASLLPLLP